jgi:predicted small lipoprotein YifL
MKKIISALAIALLVSGLTGCLDNPDDAKQRPGTSTGATIGL